MSAQAARERKKARMDELERQLGILSDRYRRLEMENYRLKERLCQYEPVDNFTDTFYCQNIPFDTTQQSSKLLPF